jgi:hypothetical protein
LTAAANWRDYTDYAAFAIKPVAQLYDLTTRKGHIMWRTFACMSCLVAIGGMAVEGHTAAQVPASGQPSQNPQAFLVNIVRINRTAGFVVVRVGDFNNSREVNLQVDKMTKYVGMDGLALANGIRSPGFKEGGDVLIVPGSGQRSRTILEMQVSNPNPTTPIPPRGPK